MRHLFIGLHEIAHIVLEHRHAYVRRRNTAWLPMWQREKDANAWAFARLAALKIRVPTKLRRDEETYWRKFTSSVTLARRKEIAEFWAERRRLMSARDNLRRELAPTYTPTDEMVAA